MAKSKNHTSHNQNRKDHRNGIKKPRRVRYPSLRGVDPKLLRNMHFSKKHNKKTHGADGVALVAKPVKVRTPKPAPVPKKVAAPAPAQKAAPKPQAPKQEKAKKGKGEAKEWKRLDTQ